MSRIDRIEIHEFTYETPNLGLDSSGFNFVYQPGGKFAMTNLRSWFARPMAVAANMSHSGAERK